MIYNGSLFIYIFFFNFRRKLDEIKRMEVEYQRDLLRQKKDHMSGIERNYWNPIHHDNKDSFEMEDLKKLLSKVTVTCFLVSFECL